MRERPDDRAAPPLPRGVLPHGQPPEGDATWDDQVTRIMAVAGAELAIVVGRQSPAGPTWWSAMAPWWKGAAVLAAASIALLVLVERRTEPPTPSRRTVALGLVASDGDPATLWSAIGVPADPVLAQIVVQSREDASNADSPRAVTDVRTP